ncbi:acyltransferase [Flavobacterium sp. GT3R68]|uniref:acyltransferase n=1 Tax=Flavobacterium sp. GT3R68 TaxID=2594437 RepID=UPI000F87AE48|nr:acyltransferase [Flavobacterium sp. GT3R68]RTY95917.1 acyltransferase [Flavobacterium sp. GSN2]TRW93689.1 acyltransferase [Flavobacterium sp. GT3R68]
MIKTLFQKLLAKSGKSYSIDSDIPDSLILLTLYKRGMMLIRGYLKTGSKVYFERHCTVYNRKNISFGKNVTIEHHTKLDGYAKHKIILGDGVKIGAYSNLLSTSHFSKFGVGLKMGNNSAVGDFTHFGAPGGIEIGDNVIMGSYVSFHSENHNFSDLNKLIREQGVTSKGIIIGNNVWVGAKVTFLDGCVVGNHSVVAAGAVVNGVFPDYSVIGGIPAKIIKKIE